MNPHGNNRRMLYNYYGGKLKKLAGFIENKGGTFFTSDFTSMAPYPKNPYTTPQSQRTRRNSQSGSRTPVARGRRMSIVSAASSRSRSSGRTSGSSILGTAGTNVISSALRKRGKSVKKEGRKKKVRISAGFRKKVKQVLTNVGPKGFMMETVPDQVLKPQDNIQEVGIACNRQIQGISGWKFSPSYVCYVYDKLYGKGAFPATDEANIDRTAFPCYNDNLVVHVVEQYYVIRMRNNSARTLDVKLWDVSPKSTQQGNTFSAYNFITQTLADNAPSGALGSLTQQGRENPQGVTINTLGYKPTMSTAFNKHFSLDETIIKLEPGKEYYHKVKGPNDKLYKYNQFKRNGTIVDAMPFCKQTMIAVNVDLTATSTLALGQAGRWTEMGSSGNPYGLLTETMSYTKIKCPDQTGFQVRSPALAAGTVQNLSEVGYAFVIKNWYEAQTEALGTTANINDENPQAATTNGQ